METKRIKLLRDTVCGGKPVMKGQEVDAVLADAHFLLRSGKAELVAEKKAAKPGPKRMQDKMEPQGETRDAG